MLSENELTRRVDAWVEREWENELREKSTLNLYREYKKEIKEEPFYDNTFDSIIFFKARSNCLQLGWRNRFQGGEIVCRMCGAEEETLEHFILECPSYLDIRLEYEMSEMDMENILGFKNQGEDVEKSKRYLKRIWVKRKQFLSRMAD